MSFLYKHIAVTHATSLHLNANVAATRFWYISFYCFECGAGATNLHCDHLVHKHASTDIALILVEMSRTRTSLCIFKSYCDRLNLKCSVAPDGLSYAVNPPLRVSHPAPFLYSMCYICVVGKPCWKP